MARICLILGLLVSGLFTSGRASAYPQFIGYKYASCLTCHFNGQGNGPLNDYGRALWANEIAGRAFARGRTDEQLGEASGFLGSKQLPYWVRPGFKLRQLQMQTDPGTVGSINRRILMQADASLALFADRDQKYAFVGSLGYVPDPQRLQNSGSGDEVPNWISREHYLRYQASEPLWLYAGMMDKVYGIRHVNHYAYSRAQTGLAQNDQSHTFLAHYIQPKWELSGDVFMGNLYQDSKRRQKGASTMFEYEVKENWRLGASALVSSNSFIGNKRLGVHSRVGYGGGSAVLFETGIIDNKQKGAKAKQGYYLYSEAIQRIIRGYHLYIVGEGYKEELKRSAADQVRLEFGLLAFPMQRLEFRFEGINALQMPSGTDIQRDTWIFLGQIHLSL
jgi:hypothetical protein